jgi:nickel superoxide dismutase
MRFPKEKHMKRIALLATTLMLLSQSNLSAHCQMPCGIYHDDMVYDQIDQFVETVYKGISVLNESKFATVKDRNEFARWVAEKESSCCETANLITVYFLQQKIKPGEDDTVKRLTSAHKLLFLLVAIKQNPDLEYVKQFNEEWEKFKLMFHRQGYECMMEKKEFADLDALRKKHAADAQKEAALSEKAAPKETKTK